MVKIGFMLYLSYHNKINPYMYYIKGNLSDFEIIYSVMLLFNVKL